MKRFLGLDVHKTVVEVCAIDEAGKILFRRRIVVMSVRKGASVSE